MDNPNFLNDDNNDDQKASSQDKSRKRSDLQREIVMQEADFKKKMNEKILIESEIRSYKKQGAQIKVEIQVRQEKLKKIDQDVMMMDNDLKSLKKKLNLI